MKAKPQRQRQRYYSFPLDWTRLVTDRAHIVVEALPTESPDDARRRLTEWLKSHHIDSLSWEYHYDEDGGETTIAGPGELIRLEDCDYTPDVPLRPDPPVPLQESTAMPKPKATPKTKTTRDQIIPELLKAIGPARVKQFRADVLRVWQDLLSGNADPIDEWEALMSRDLERKLKPVSAAPGLAERNFDALICQLAFKFPIGPSLDSVPIIYVVQIHLVRIGKTHAEITMPEITGDVAVKTKHREPYAIISDGFYQFVGEFVVGSKGFPDEPVNVVARWIPNPFWQYVSC